MVAIDTHVHIREVTEIRDCATHSRQSGLCVWGWIEYILGKMRVQMLFISRILMVILLLSFSLYIYINTGNDYHKPDEGPVEQAEKFWSDLPATVSLSCIQILPRKDFIDFRYKITHVS